jgi:hypothetical protein
MANDQTGNATINPNSPLVAAKPETASKSLVGRIVTNCSVLVPDTRKDAPKGATKEVFFETGKSHETALKSVLRYENYLELSNLGALSGSAEDWGFSKEDIAAADERLAAEQRAAEMARLGLAA